MNLVLKFKYIVFLKISPLNFFSVEKQYILIEENLEKCKKV